MEKKETIICANRKAHFDYEIIETYTAGISLLGKEVSSLKMHKGNIGQSFCHIKDGQMIISNMYIDWNVDKTRDRILLLNRREITKLEKSVETKGMTIIPLKVILNERHLFKVVIGLCRGKKTYDKKQTIKERDIDRDAKRSI